MRHLFSTKLRIILVVAVLLSAALAVVAGVTNQTLPGMIVQGILAPFRGAMNGLTNLAEQYYSYMFRYESLVAENQKLKADMAQMEDVARQADAVSRENERLRKMIGLQSTHESYKTVDAYIIGWSSSDFSNTFTINRGTTSGIQTNMVAITENGEEVRLKATGFLARTLLHEIDHLDGVLFIDHIKDQTDAFYKLNDKGDLEPLDYDKYIKNNKNLFPDEEE